MNGAEVILADEPTGALDSRSGEEVLALLTQLHAQGRTIILITHDAAVAAHAQRVIQIKDGRIVEDSGTRPRTSAAEPSVRLARTHPHWLADLGEAVKMALRSLRANLFRSALTLLGVVIGVAAVVTMLAIGNGSKQQVMQRIQSMGTNLLLVFPGAPGTRPAAISRRSSRPMRKPSASCRTSQASRLSGAAAQTLRFGSLDYQTSVTGVWPGYVDTQGWQMARGSFVTEEDVKSYAAVIVLGKTVADNLFPSGEDPIGKFVLVGNIPFEVIGVLAPKGANAFGSDMDDAALVPLSTGSMRVFGVQYLNSINVKINVDRGQRCHAERDHLAAPGAPRPAGLPGAQHQLAAGDGRVDAEHADLAARLGRGDLAAGRRHRRHEHHAGQRDRAYARDRRAHGDRRADEQHSAAVQHRGAGGVRHRRAHRRRAGIRCRLRRAGFRHQRRVHSDAGDSRVHFGFRNRAAVRLSAGAQSCAHGSGHCTGIRIRESIMNTRN